MVEKEERGFIRSSSVVTELTFQLDLDEQYFRSELADSFFILESCLAGGKIHLSGLELSASGGFGFHAKN